MMMSGGEEAGSLQSHITVATHDMMMAAIIRTHMWNGKEGV